MSLPQRIRWLGLCWAPRDATTWLGFDVDINMEIKCGCGVPLWALRLRPLATLFQSTDRGTEGDNVGIQMTTIRQQRQSQT